MKRQIAQACALLATTLLGACASQSGGSGFWNDHYVFVSAASGHNDIYLSDIQGKSVRQLTHDTADDTHPRVTLDGQIVFASKRTGTWQIYRMDWDGSNVMALTNTSGTNNYRPTPSPDGRIVFVSDRLGKPNIYSVNADGSHVERLSEGDFWYDYPVVADNGHIYFTSSRNSKWDIWRMGPDGSRPTQVTKLPQNVKEIAVVSPVYKDYDTRFTTRSTMIPFSGFYSPNRLIFSAYTEKGNLSLYRVNEDGSDLRELSLRSQYSNRSPVLLPTGQVMFTSDRNGSTDIWTMYPDGMQVRPLISGPAYESTS